MPANMVLAKIPMMVVRVPTVAGWVSADLSWFIGILII